jgi:D-beta-D-heptose 7-phosphate kinase/D-beta-D-heptose 1-phosphate adenosyltransferase
MASILSREELSEVIGKLQSSGKKIVFTNGVFDILHKGHVDYLSKARSFGDILVVGINSDSSVKRIKGERRPIVPQSDRACLVSNLKSVDYVCIFDEDTPYETIRMLRPDFLVKGADWKIENVIGRDIVEGRGGKVVTIEYVDGRSTTNIIKKILEVMQ